MLIIIAFQSMTGIHTLNKIVLRIRSLALALTCLAIKILGYVDHTRGEPSLHPSVYMISHHTCYTSRCTNVHRYMKQHCHQTIAWQEFSTNTLANLWNFRIWNSTRKWEKHRSTAIFSYTRLVWGSLRLAPINKLHTLHVHIIIHMKGFGHAAQSWVAGANHSKKTATLEQWPYNI